jgi:hypothetical protein
MNLRIILLCFLFVGSAHADADEFESLYGQLLASYWRPTVSINGINTTVFDYAKMKSDSEWSQSLFTKVLKAISEVSPSELQGPDEEKAFWINAYNFAAMSLVIEHYPVDSIRSLRISLVKYPWSKKAIQIGINEYSLKQIEKDILLEKFDDPRIVFAVSCAAVSCPDRIAEPFTAEKIDRQLDDMIGNFFLNTRKGLLLNRSKKTLTLSWILKKDRDIFAVNEGGVVGFVLPYLSTVTQNWLNANSVNIDYFEHDWTLNDLTQASIVTKDE